VYFKGPNLAERLRLEEWDLTAVDVNLLDGSFGIDFRDPTDGRGFNVPLLLRKGSEGIVFSFKDGRLQIRQSRGLPPGTGDIWLNLPPAYKDKIIPEVDIRCLGSTTVRGANIDALYVEAGGDVDLSDLTIDQTCLAKSRRGGVKAARVGAPADVDPETVAVDLISFQGEVAVDNIRAALRVAGWGFTQEGAMEGSQIFIPGGPVHRTQQAQAA
jgi:hypothetical protein